MSNDRDDLFEQEAEYEAIFRSLREKYNLDGNKEEEEKPKKFYNPEKDTELNDFFEEKSKMAQEKAEEYMYDEDDIPTFEGADVEELKIDDFDATSGHEAPKSEKETTYEDFVWDEDTVLDFGGINDQNKTETPMEFEDISSTKTPEEIEVNSLAVPEAETQEQDISVEDTQIREAVKDDVVTQEEQVLQIDLEPTQVLNTEDPAAVILPELNAEEKNIDGMFFIKMDNIDMLDLQGEEEFDFADEEIDLTQNETTDENSEADPEEIAVQEIAPIEDVSAEEIEAAPTDETTEEVEAAPAEDAVEEVEAVPAVEAAEETAQENEVVSTEETEENAEEVPADETAANESEATPLEEAEDVPAEAADEKVEGEEDATEDGNKNEAVAEEDKGDEAETVTEVENTGIMKDITYDNINWDDFPTPKEHRKQLKKQKKAEKKKGKRGLFPKKGDSAGEIVRKIILLISILAILGSSGWLTNDLWIQPLLANKLYGGIIDDLVDTDDDRDITSFDDMTDEERAQATKELLAQNPDYIGWLTVKGAGVSLPVVMANSNSKYLRMGFDGKWLIAGTLFVSAPNRSVADKNVVIYGHNMNNGSMFGLLRKYKETDGSIYRDYPYITFYTVNGSFKYEIYAAFLADGAGKSDNYFVNTAIKTSFSEKAFLNYMTAAKQKAYYKTSVEVSADDKIITLVTCDRTHLRTGRLVMVAKLIEEF